jgi:hypothetical protein
MRGRIDWSEIPLGRVPDEELARRLNVTRQAVAWQRNARKIPPFGGAPPPGALTRMELDDIAALERGYAELLDEDRPHLSIATAAAVARTPGWRVDARRARASGGDGKERGGRATSLRFRAPGRRSWTPRMGPAAAREWLLANGWADEATKRIEELRGRDTTERTGARA